MSGSSIPSAFIESIATALGIETTKEAQRCLSLDLEYKIRDIIQVRSNRRRGDFAPILGFFPARNSHSLEIAPQPCPQYAQKVARKSRRSTINAEDVNQAFRHLNVEPIYGISNVSDPFRFVKLAGHAQVMRVSDPVIPVDTVLETPLVPPPWEAGVRIHWLAIDGRQPNVPENVPMLKPTRKPKRRKADILAAEPGEEEKGTGADGEKGGSGAARDNPGGVLVKAPLKHVLSRELNLYLDRAMGVLEGREGGVESDKSNNNKLLDATLASLRLDAGIQPLAPYVCHTLAQNIWMELAGASRDEEEEDYEVENNENDENADDKDGAGKKKVYDPAKLNAFLRASECIASNRTLDLSWYLHELIPAVVDVVLDVDLPVRDGKVGKDEDAKESRLQELNRLYRWDQREFAAKALASICVWYPEVAPRVQKQFVESLRANPETHIPAIYGAILGIACQGERAVQTLLLPNLLPLVRNLSARAKSCSPRELDIVRDVLLTTAGSLLRKRGWDQRLRPFRVEMSLGVRARGKMGAARADHGDTDMVDADGMANGDDPPRATRAKSGRSLKSTKSKSRRNSAPSHPSLEDVFKDDHEDEGDDPKAAMEWLKKYMKANKATMEAANGNGEGRYHAAITYKNAAGEMDVKHQTRAEKSGGNHLEAFPVSAVALDVKILQKAWAEEPRPEEYRRLVSNVFGMQSDPYCVYDEKFLL